MPIVGWIAAAIPMTSNTTPTELAAEAVREAAVKVCYDYAAGVPINLGIIKNLITVSPNKRSAGDDLGDAIRALDLSTILASLTPATEPLSTETMVSRASYNRLYHQFDLKCREVNALSAQPRTDERLAELPPCVCGRDPDLHISNSATAGREYGFFCPHCDTCVGLQYKLTDATLSWQAYGPRPRDPSHIANGICRPIDTALTNRAQST